MKGQEAGLPSLTKHWVASTLRDVFHAGSRRTVIQGRQVQVLKALARIIHDSSSRNREVA
jgi:hypothetical protein